VPLSVSYEISEYWPGLLDSHLMHNLGISDIKDVKVSATFWRALISMIMKEF
jgi:hypothetical protein